MIEGVTINLGGEDFIVPPLSFKQLRTLEPKLKNLGALEKGKMPSSEQLMAIVEIIHAAISRNYPDTTIDRVEELLDLSNMMLVVGAVMGVSGLVQAGELKAGGH